jgi:Ca-activated chloride channel family protein
MVALAGLYPWLTRGRDLEQAIWQRWYFVFGLALVPVVLLLGTLYQGARRPHVLVGTVFPLARGPRGIRTYLRDVPGVARAAALVFLIGAMCRPVNVKKDERAEDKGIDIMIVMDLSGSMKAVLDGDPDDLPGRPNLAAGQRLTRLETAKVVVKDFVSRRKSDRIGVVVFAKQAYLLSPPTLDYQLLTKLVSKLSLRVIDESGTAIGDALATAVTRMRHSDAQSKVIILITDGDSNAGKVAPELAAQLAAEDCAIDRDPRGLPIQPRGAKSCVIHTIQVGSGDEVDVEDGTDWLGHPRYVRQRFPVNPELLKRISDQTKGQSFIATDGKALTNSMHTILDSLEKTRFEAPRSSFEDLFPLLLFPGVALLGLDVLLRVLLLRRFP